MHTNIKKEKESNKMLICGSEVANVHSCHNAHLVVVVRVLMCRVSTEMADSRMTVGQLRVLARWLAWRLPGGIFWKAFVLIQEAAILLVDQLAIWDAQVKDVWPTPWLGWGLVQMYQHVIKTNASLLTVGRNEWWTQDGNLCMGLFAPPCDGWKRHDPTGVAQKVDAFVVIPFRCHQPFSRPVITCAAPCPYHGQPVCFSTPPWPHPRGVWSGDTAHKASPSICYLSDLFWLRFYENI